MLISVVINKKTVWFEKKVFDKSGLVDFYKFIG